jgi:hypothetical protein
MGSSIGLLEGRSKRYWVFPFLPPCQAWSGNGYIHYLQPKLLSKNHVRDDVLYRFWDPLNPFTTQTWSESGSYVLCYPLEVFLIMSTSVEIVPSVMPSGWITCFLLGPCLIEHGYVCILRHSQDTMK